MCRHYYSTVPSGAEQHPPTRRWRRLLCRRLRLRPLCSARLRRATAPRSPTSSGRCPSSTRTAASTWLCACASRPRRVPVSTSRRSRRWQGRSWLRSSRWRACPSTARSATSAACSTPRRRAASSGSPRQHAHRQACSRRQWQQREAAAGRRAAARLLDVAVPHLDVRRRAEEGREG